MIDFVSTREHVDQQSKQAARLLAAWVARHIRDAAEPPSRQEIDAGTNFTRNAARSIDYLFSADSPFEDHIELIGGGAQAMRDALLSDRTLAAGSQFTLAQREIIQARHAWWRAAHTQPKEAA